mmetsp:Transcript_19481/g.50681  ORF Transcript_19481/g.50681 Transcript_19481/m.50681 type:complete len:391 (-) Transcript_19481:211-1383(-)
MFKKKSAKKKAEAPAAQGDGGDIPFRPTGIPNAGDVELRAFRKKTKDPRLLEDRKYFNERLKMLQAGYRSPETLLDYAVDRTLGTGSFGRVVMAQGKGRTDFHAVKIIAKERVVKTRQVEHTRNEKNILFCMKNPFIVGLRDYYQDAKCLYFVLEFVNGGEMFTHIQKQKRRRFTAEQTRFFAAETVLAFEYLHNLDIIFRDLKPENMLIDHRGHVRLTDFGFAKRVDDKTWTMCGTPEYLAPEIIVNKGYNHAVDWWAVGVLIYEMRCGRSPFEATSQLQMFKKISKRDFKYPRDFTADEEDLIGGLLQVDLTRRLGAMVGGVNDIKTKKYFGMGPADWEAMGQQKIPSPYCPKVKHAGDTDNFDQYEEATIKWYGTGSDKFGDTFESF